MISHELAHRAQTNIQLYNQLSDRGFSAADILQVQRAYTTAADLFAGQVRPEGRPFICHLVGVASILALLGEPVGAVSAGLLHSAYAQGDFGDGKGRVNKATPRTMANSVNRDTQILIETYGQTAWNAANVLQWTIDADALNPTLRSVIITRLADALEDSLDFGLQYSAKGQKHSSAIPREAIVALATALGHVQLASALKENYAASGPAELFELLRDKNAGSYVTAPRSYRAKFWPVISKKPRRLVAAVLRRLPLIAN